MLRSLAWVTLCVATAGTVASAHHSYGAYDRERKVAVAGTLERISVGNPHTILAVRTDDGTLFTAEWRAASQLQRSGFDAGMLAAGDRVIVTGSPARDADAHRLALVTEVRRPRDGWQWSLSGVTVLKDIGRR